MTLVVDVSVAAKWFFREEQRDEALRLIDFRVPLVAPTLFKVEFANLLWKKVRRLEIDLPDAMELQQQMEAFLSFVDVQADLLVSALRMSHQLDHPVYDCVYLSLAESLGTRFITADGRLINKLAAANLDYLAIQLGRFPSIDEPLQISNATLCRLIELSRRLETTFSHVIAHLKGPEETFHFHSMEDLRPAFDSPAGRTLTTMLRELSHSELIDVATLGWLGQGYSGRAVDDIKQRARQAFADGAHNHLGYISSLLQYVSAGRDLLRAADPNTSR